MARATPRLASLFWLLPALLLTLLGPIDLKSQSVTIAQDFSIDPLNGDWRVLGDSSLFTLNQIEKNLSVTWDSSRSNSYYYVPLGTILNRNDDFSLDLDLKLQDIEGGVNPNKPSTFELSLGFLNKVDATKSNFFRGNSSASPNLVEFDFFPDTGFGPTIWPSIWSTNSSLNYNGSADYSLLSLPVGQWMHLSMRYAASNHTLTTLITTNGITIGAIHSIPLSSTFTDFRVNAFAIESYSDAGQDPNYGGSLLAHGKIDNIVLMIPPAPVLNLAGKFTNQQFELSFTSRTNWVYAFERTSGFLSWTTISPMIPGNGAALLWRDTNVPPANAFYRVRAERH